MTEHLNKQSDYVLYYRPYLQNLTLFTLSSHQPCEVVLLFPFYQ